MAGRFNLDGCLRTLKECLTGPESSDRIGPKSNTYIYIYIYCDGPLLHNERLLTDVISTVTDTENYPITRSS
jgi:hypothetical protein